MFPLIEPTDFTTLDVGEEGRPAGQSRPDGAAAVTRSSMRQAMNAYRDHEWTLTDDNLRNPCETLIVAGTPAACRRPDRFVPPP